MGRYCSQCGSSVRYGAVYCSDCGSILTADPPSRPIPVFPFGLGRGVGLGADGLSFTRREAAFEVEGLKNITVFCRMFDVEIMRTENPKVVLKWDETASWGVFSEKAGDSLRVSEQNYLGLQNIPNYLLMHHRKELRIELPKDYTGALMVENEAGSIVVNDLELEGKIELKTSLGQIRGRGLKTSENFRADTASGSLDVANIEAGGSIQLSSMALGMRAERIKAADGITVSSSNGRCLLREITAGEYLSVTGSLGQVVLDTASAVKLDIGVSGSGLVDCRKISAGESITITSTTGSITCEIDDAQSNFTSYCRSTHGQCNLPEASGEGAKTLRASTGIGNISIHFLGGEKKSEEAS